jgi:NAD(P)-dependent dehydrogenase (short-subunit alcohol dehydrogenase family)
MNSFSEKIALVTGGASGIGRALGAALARAGAEVVLADIDGDGAEQAALAIAAAGGRARAATLDVRDAPAFAALVDQTVARHGRIDYLFNNAGIGIAGEARDLGLDDWNRIIDINLRGVVHGVAAAYPAMLRQRSGHIVNTASLAGLSPSPGLAPYSATKFAVVGLSHALRVEAMDLGVRVSVVCPGFIDTPIYQRSTYINLDKERVLSVISRAGCSADRCARAILDGVRRNRPLILVTWEARVLSWLYRISPRLSLRLAHFLFRKFRLLRNNTSIDAASQ